MAYVSIARDALHEIHDRMSSHTGPMGILITGPMAADCRAPVDLEEAWALERLYGPSPRWVIEILPLRALAEVPVEPSAKLFSQDVSGIHVKIVTTQAVEKLRVELRGGNLRVFEDDV